MTNMKMQPDKDSESIPLEGFTFANDLGSDGKDNSTAAQQVEDNSEMGRSASKRKLWKAAWYDFSQTTTLHGINKITDETPYTIRRILWICIVLLGISLFTNQLIQSVIYYLSYPVTVNVKINYNTTLIFPAVTVCNQNDFRMTAASENGKYHLIQEYYWKLGSDERVDLLSNNATNITIDTLYYEAAHTKEDLIVSCEWDKKPCDMSRIYRELTDYGMCYTFNSAQYGDEIHNISRTGADRGLRLGLNVEQYEYMVGPNPGAGIKLLIHENTEIPLVRDLGLAIPPGTHAYVGVQIVEVNNLGPPHGRCNSSVKLDYYKYYSLTACMVECKEKYLIKECNCRDAYMQADPGGLRGDQSNIREGMHPVCTMEQYQNCAVPKMEYFYDEDDQCECPIPCSRLVYDSTITYADASSLDAERFLHSTNATRQLQQRYVEARETRQRVNKFIVLEDEEMVEEFSQTVTALEEIFRHASEEIDTINRWATYYLMPTLSRSAFFHKRWGLEKLKFIAKQDFVRGWLVFKERTFDWVVSSYQEIAGYIEETFEQANMLGEEDAALRQALYAAVQKELSMKKIICTRALLNITQVETAYMEVEPILQYKASPFRHYDMTWVSEKVVRSSPYIELPYFGEFRQYLQQFQEAILAIEEMNSQMGNGTQVDMEAYREWVEKFARAARGYNFKYYMLDSRIVNAPVEYTDQLLLKFAAYNDSLWSTYTDFLHSLTHFNVFFDEATHSWKEVIDFRDGLLAYLNDSSLTKTSLAERITSKTMAAHMETLRHFFAEARSRMFVISGDLTALKSACLAIWKSMLEQSELDNFYQTVYNDIQNVSTTNSTKVREYFDGIFGYMIGKSPSWVLENLDLVYLFMNGDFAVTTLANKTEDIMVTFAAAQRHLDAVNFDRRDERFLNRFESMRAKLEQYLAENHVGESFYRDNFMSVDIFMKELNYEQIQQQVGYDTTSLWSDIGGSMGLFIGASVITAFEMIDVILHNVMRLHCSK